MDSKTARHRPLPALAAIMLLFSVAPGAAQEPGAPPGDSTQLAAKQDASGSKVSTAQESMSLPSYLRDRGPGIPTSLFGTYVRHHELLIFPFVAYTYDHNFEYQPEELNVPGTADFRGLYHDFSTQLFVAYGITTWLAFELEAGFLKASLEKSPEDSSSLPAKIEESGLSDVEGQARIRLLRESGSRPEIYGFLEITAATNTDKVLIGDPYWDFRPGLGVIRGFSFGTLTFRTDLEYNRPDEAWDLGETSLEYLKRLSDAWKIFAAIEGGETGAPDDYGLDTGVYWRMSRIATLKFDNHLGVQSKSPDWVPQIGVLFSLL